MKDKCHQQRNISQRGPTMVVADHLISLFPKYARRVKWDHMTSCGDKTSVVLAPIRPLGVDKDKLCSYLIRLNGTWETLCHLWSCPNLLFLLKKILTGLRFPFKVLCSFCKWMISICFVMSTNVKAADCFLTKKKPTVHIQEKCTQGTEDFYLRAKNFSNFTRLWMWVKPYPNC